MKSNNRMSYEKIGKKKLSEIGGQEIINLYDGGKLGVVADVDLLIDDETGYIEALLIPDTKSLFSIFSNKNYIEVPWESVKKIGQDTLIVELNEKINRK
ncbi:YlmC/YmxH family sporulation protein [Oxobacter pfennigii]|uniref:YlmC/YmxH family sporulation protein n=1 Tax=Oxobacter pfennigii TaxID=36849 RepID=UPI001FA6EDCA|nr:YlmC/YmxH family sporulation protein [Oxobacter pfennigii]